MQYLLGSHDQGITILTVHDLDELLPGSRTVRSDTIVKSPVTVRAVIAKYLGNGRSSQPKT